MLDGRGVQQAAKCQEVWRESGRWGRWGRGGQSEFHLQPVGGAGLVLCRATVWLRRDKMSSVHVQLVEAGAREAVCAVVPVGARGGGLGLQLYWDWGTTAAWAGILQVIHRQQREGPAKQLRRTSVTTQVGQPCHQLAICSQDQG